MAILTLYDEQFSCSVAMKGDDFIRLLDEEGNVVFYADGITDFSPYILDGSWEYPYKGSATIVSCTANLSNSVLSITPRVPCKIEDFTTLVFQAPCDCTSVASLSICGKTYAMLNATGQTINGIGGAWCDGALVSLMVDHVNKRAYVLNHSTLSVTHTTTLSNSGWSSSAPYTQTISLGGVLASDDPFVDVYLEGVSDGTAIIEAWSVVGRVSTADGSITAYCYEEKPSIDIPIILKVVR